MPLFGFCMRMGEAFRVISIQKGTERPLDASIERRIRRMFNRAVILLVIAFLLFLCQLANLGVFKAKASSEDVLPISIRATSRADYSGDRVEQQIPAIDQDILFELITDMPSENEAQNRAGTLQASLSSPVPTMTPDLRVATKTPTKMPTFTSTRVPTTPTSTVTAPATTTRTPEPSSTATVPYPIYYFSTATATKTPKPPSSATPSVTPTNTSALTPDRKSVV